MRKFYEYGFEPTLRVRYTGSNLKVTGNNFPELHRELSDACEILGIERMPDLFLNQGFINARTTGVQNPTIIMDFGCVSLLSANERMFILGHELGHIKSEHVLYHDMATVLPVLGDMAGQVTLGIGKMIESGVTAALQNWKQMSEFTADRAGLLCCQDKMAASKVFMKLAGAPPAYYSRLRVQDFIDQARHFEDLDLVAQNKVAKVIAMLQADHPWTVVRGSELLKWSDAGEYQTVLTSARAA